jgi:hypothetical protein
MLSSNLEASSRTPCSTRQSASVWAARTVSPSCVRCAFSEVTGAALRQCGVRQRRDREERRRPALANRLRVPPNADVYAVHEVLERGGQAKRWEFEEGHCGHRLRE